MAEQKKNDTVSKDEKKERVRQEFLELRRTGDPKLRNKLIMDHLYIAEILAKKYVNRGIEFDDLYQVASMGLIYAIDRYDVTKGFEFSSFATPTIVGELKRYFRDKGWVIRVPRRIQELSKRVNQVKVSLIQELQRQPTVDDIADALGVSAEEVLEAMDSSKVYAPQSLDQTMDSSNDDHDVNLGNLIGQDDKSFEQVDFYDVIERLSKGLNDLEKRIFYDRYYDKRTQIAIAEELGVSQMTVSRIEKKIIEKFRQELNIRPEDLSKKRKSASKKKSKKEN
ncbi:MAG: SigB/SigF/SigG family RNA polymerase sigma factor [Peptoniphilaceae bacterium]|nr:SigB/SigF/SigG family RNA polymerase sigma factor [Peptoniphilaceae bacterium]MDY5766216.1 SigB/SigF/SigG family RNA polymerase sigma factor [Peptoniphilaceae bacterium]